MVQLINYKVLIHVATPYNVVHGRTFRRLVWLGQNSNEQIELIKASTSTNLLVRLFEKINLTRDGKETFIVCLNSTSNSIRI